MSKKALSIEDFTRLCKQSGINSSILNMLASCILWHEKHKIGLYSISLKPILYKRFIETMEKINGAPFEPGTPFELCHVQIIKGSFLQSREMLPEQWKDYQNNIGEKHPEHAH